MVLGGSSWKTSVRLVIGRSRVRILLGLQNPRSESVSPNADGAAARGGSFLWVGHHAAGALAHFAGGCSAGTSSAVDGSPLSATPGGIVEGGRLGRPWGPGAHSRAISEHQLALRRCSHISTTRMPSHAERSEPHVRTEVRAARASRVSLRVSSTLAGLKRELSRPWQQAITWSITAA